MRGLPRQFELSEVLTDAEIVHARKLYRRFTRGFHVALLERVISPAWPRITGVLGADCSARFVAYGIEYQLLHDKQPANTIKPRKPWQQRIYGKRHHRPQEVNIDREYA